MAPFYHFYNGPGSNPFSSARIGIFGLGYTPCVSIDGLPASYTPSTFAAAINSRLAVPSYVSIDVECVGDETGGTAFISVTAEQDLDTGVKLWSAILEDHEIATSAWGGYNGQEMMWIPVVAPTATAGTVLNFTGPYPQTIEVQGTYTLNPSSHPFDNLNFAAIVQGYQSNDEKEVFNAYFSPLAYTGVGESSSASVSENVHLAAWPNPASGAFSVVTQIPQGVIGTVEIFDVTGRAVSTFDAGSSTTMNIDEPGVYFIRLTTSTGEVVNRQIAVVR
ncbi:MAG TPA: T9SS type A sorting domain-containing protein [Candidatus Sabulitectum sp.]|nr:T9SS type A sorting domain-containing protein [Candidatus Sabulitectum sp.]HPR23508.1 T9SS type A sorting domain-containing protein [Candidatus Sabulitectum sp.]